jgi:hypothetical protein
VKRTNALFVGAKSWREKRYSLPPESALANEHDVSRPGNGEDCCMSNKIEDIDEECDYQLVLLEL